MKSTYDTLILGASYGSLLATKLLLAGHNVTLVGMAAEVAAINEKGIRLRLPIRGRTEPVEIASRSLPGKLDAALPGAADPRRHDLVVLAMQEPQYGAVEVRDLLDEIARARVPSMSIMNMPPLPYLKRLPHLATDRLADCYTDATVWQNFEPAATTSCSPDPQALRPSKDEPDLLEVTLPTNFKAARFAADDHTSMLRKMAADIEAVRYETGGERIELPVKLKVHDSIFVPLDKWAMLLTGNYRCVGRKGLRSIKDAVHGNIEESRGVYDWVCELCVKLGAAQGELVPFEKYANAAAGLVRPSGVARALFAGATAVERVDRLVHSIAAQKGMRSTIVDEIVGLVDARIAANRKPVS